MCFFFGMGWEWVDLFLIFMREYFIDDVVKDVKNGYVKLLEYFFEYRCSSFVGECGVGLVLIWIFWCRWKLVSVWFSGGFESCVMIWLGLY